MVPEQSMHLLLKLRSMEGQRGEGSYVYTCMRHVSLPPAVLIVIVMEPSQSQVLLHLPRVRYIRKSIILRDRGATGKKKT